MGTPGRKPFPQVALVGESWKHRVPLSVLGERQCQALTTLLPALRSREDQLAARQGLENFPASADRVPPVEFAQRISKMTALHSASDRFGACLRELLMAQNLS